MYTFFEQKQTINYNGDQLRSQFNYELTKHAGDSIIAFFGEMNVSKDHMVDIEDVVNNDFIYSPSAINFIIELFDVSMESTALYQMAFMRIIHDVITQYMDIQRKQGSKSEEGYKYGKIDLDGDDLFCIRDFSPPRKLSVSIATKSILSGLIHVGLNVTVNERVPVLAAGLGELFSADEICYLVQTIQSQFAQFVEDIKRRKVKVRGVQ